VFFPAVHVLAVLFVLTASDWSPGGLQSAYLDAPLILRGVVLSHTAGLCLCHVLEAVRARNVHKLPGVRILSIFYYE
jgi:hypothetical protein